MQSKLIKFLCICLFIQACNTKNTQENTQNTDSTSQQSESSSLELAKAANFQQEIDGKKTDLFTLKNASGMTTTITNYGGRVVNLYVKNKSGEWMDVVLGLEKVADYVATTERYLGANVGRYGNRIAKGKFSLDGKTYTLATNNAPNHLHGGKKGFQDLVWDARQVNDSTLELSYLSKDGEEGYPGNLQIKITYQLTTDNALQVDFEATSDKKTICNLTHHSYFNLNGVKDTSTINNHLLMIPAEKFTPVDATLIPTGVLATVEGTPFDFRKETPIGARLNDKHPQLEYGKGYDHNFVLPAKEDTSLQLNATVYSPKTGIFMEVFSTEPGVQFYGGNFLNGTVKGKGGVTYIYRSALCLEPQHFPDSPNRPDFPSTVLNPGETYRNTIIYKFSTK
ncbi:MAG: aldose epimerase family protein [Microscillaceae bacterium]|nr:aldose epimerase family protein [Microscillaceae bacterium]